MKPNFLYLTLLCSLLSVSACTDDHTGSESSDDKEFNYSMHDLPLDEQYQGPFDLGQLHDGQKLKEASGLVASQQSKNLLWTHNDSGDKARIFAIDTTGKLLLEVTLEETTNRDWEDIAIAKNLNSTSESEFYLYIGDIGDNKAQYDSIQIHRIKEPVQFDTSAISLPKAEFETYNFIYPDGPKDAETLLVDPWTLDLYIVTKREKHTYVYWAPSPQDTYFTTELIEVAEIPFVGCVGGDISPDGTKILLKDYNTIYSWKRENGESLVEAFQRQPLEMPYVPEPQGEAVGWSANGEGYFTLSESAGDVTSHLYLYQLKR
ncbi:hypothetical protein V6R21_13600 [Limibacter armeniacum]|uniref:hypothetical protein n=1 Tax=Limibacter armeniacum TaxID=466084 RepID=UPI002FE5C711